MYIFDGDVIQPSVVYTPPVLIRTGLLGRRHQAEIPRALGRLNDAQLQPRVNLPPQVSLHNGIEGAVPAIDGPVSRFQLDVVLQEVSVAHLPGPGKHVVVRQQHGHRLSQFSWSFQPPDGIQSKLFDDSPDLLAFRGQRVVPLWQLLTRPRRHGLHVGHVAPMALLNWNVISLAWILVVDGSVHAISGSSRDHHRCVACVHHAAADTPILVTANHCRPPRVHFELGGHPLVSHDEALARLGLHGDHARHSQRDDLVRAWWQHHLLLYIRRYFPLMKAGHCHVRHHGDDSPAYGQSVPGVQLVDPILSEKRSG